MPPSQVDTDPAVDAEALPLVITSKSGASSDSSPHHPFGFRVLALVPACVLAAFSGLLLMLAFPWIGWSWVSLLALLPWMRALAGQGGRCGALIGATHGLVFQGYIMWWASFFGPPAMLFLTCYKAVLPALVGAALGWLSRRAPQLFPLAAVSAYVSLEYGQTFGPFGITWGMLSHAWARFPVLIQIDSLGGPWALSGCVLLLQACAFCWLFPAGRRQAGAWSVAAALAWSFCLGFGVWKLAQPDTSGAVVKIGAVQVSADRSIKWNPQKAFEIVARLGDLSVQAGQQGARILLWPETSWPYRGFRSQLTQTELVAKLAQKAHVWMVVGSIEMMNDGGRHTHNTASLISPEGEYPAHYDKQRLVPGGEYLPFESWLRGIKIFDRIMRFLPGEGDGIFHFGDLQVHGGMLICFESMVPYLAANRVQHGANLLLIATNDAWFGDNNAIMHHFEMAIMRAVEQGVPALQCGNTGVSGVIDARGRVQVESLINQPCIVTADVRVPPSGVASWYAWWGDLLAYAALAVFAATLLRARGTSSSAGNV